MVSPRLRSRSAGSVADPAPAAPAPAGAGDRIEITGLHKQFRRTGGGVVNAVDDISLSIGHGEMVVLLGPSGCGKTSLLRCIGGLERPESGEIVVDGQTMFSSAKKVNRAPNMRGISMMFQSYALWPHMTVARNVAYPLHGKNLSRKETLARVEQILEIVGMGGLGRQYPAQLSGGQQQRVALARSLVTDPRVILFDEPLSNVDAKVREELRVELMTKQKELGFTGVYVTHDQIEALQLADRLVVLEQGRIAQIDEPRALYARPNNLRVARFVGTLNELPGELAGPVASDGRVEVTCALGRIVGYDPSGALAAGAVGDPVVIGIRAEAISLVREPHEVPSGDNRVSGSIIVDGFAGAYKVRVFESGDLRLDVHTPVGGSGRALNSGAAIAHIEPTRTMVFAP